MVCGILFEGSASGGYCGEWTFTLPWVPYRQYDWILTGPFSGPKALRDWLQGPDD